MSKSIYEIRRENLLNLIAQYDTDAEFCLVAKIATGYLSQLKMGGKPIGTGRNIGEKSARKLETNLGLKPMSLDISSKPNQIKETTANYQTKLSTKQQQAQRIINKLTDQELDLVLPILQDIDSRK